MSPQPTVRCTSVQRCVVLLAGTFSLLPSATGGLSRHSPHTLTRLLHSSGWEIEAVIYYQNRRDDVRLAGGFTRAVRLSLENAARRLAASRRWPYWCDGLIAVARPAS